MNKLLFVCLTGMLFFIAAAGAAQDRKLTLKITNSPLPKVLDEIQRKTRYNILYSDEVVQDSMYASIDAVRRPASEILQTILPPQNLFYILRGNDKIVIGSELLRKQGANLAFAQSKIEGRVMDDNRQPVPFATLALLKDKKNLLIMACNEQGRFEFTFPVSVDSLYRIALSSVGFLPKEINFTYPDISKLKHIVLEKDKNVLEGVKITAVKPLMERLADRFVFTPDKLMTEGSTVGDLLRQVPLIIYDERTNAISLLGKPGTKVYINNRNTDIPAAMLAEIFRAMPASNIKSIDLITNPGSEYAANMTGGVININLKRQLNEGWLGSINLYSEQGYYNFSGMSSYLNYHKGKITLQLMPTASGNYNFYSAQSRLDYTNGDRTDINTRFFRRYNVLGNGLKIDYDINKKNYLSYNGWFSYVKGRSNGSATSQFGQQDQPFIDSTEVLNTSGQDRFIYNFGNINYHKSIDSSDKKYIDANIDYNHFYQKRENAWGAQFSSVLPQKFLNISAKLQYRQNLGKDASLITGFQLSSSETKNDQTYYELNGPAKDQDVRYRYNEKYYAAFGSVSKNFGKKWNTKVGLRAEAMQYRTEELEKNIRADSSYVTLFPDAGISFSPGNKNQFGLNFAKKISRPDIELLFPGRTYISNTYFAQNNPFLQPVIMNRLDFTYMFKNRYIFSLAYQATRNNYTKFIIPVVEDQQRKLQSTYLNYGNARNFSAAVNFQQTAIKDLWSFYWTSSYNYTLYYGKVSEAPVYKTNNSVGLYINNTFYISKKKKWTAFAIFNYASPNINISGQKGGWSTLALEVKKVIKDLAINLRISDLYNGSSNIRYQWFANSIIKEHVQYSNAYPRVVTLRMVYSFGNQRVKTAKDRSSANDDIRKRVN